MSKWLEEDLYLALVSNLHQLQEKRDRYLSLFYYFCCVNGSQAKIMMCKIPGVDGDSLLNGLNWLKVTGEIVKASLECSKFNVRVVTAPW